MIELACRRHYQHDRHLGYITTCPSNLGTAMRASMHVKLTQLSSQKYKKELDDISGKYMMLVRKYSQSFADSHIYDVSNKLRLGRSERDLIQDVMDCVHNLFKEESRLQLIEDQLEADRRGVSLLEIQKE